MVIYLREEGGGELLQYSCVLPLSHFHFLEARQEWPVMT